MEYDLLGKNVYISAKRNLRIKSSIKTYQSHQKTISLTLSIESFTNLVGKCVWYDGNGVYSILLDEGLKIDIKESDFEIYQAQKVVVYDTDFEKYKDCT